MRRVIRQILGPQYLYYNDFPYNCFKAASSLQQFLDACVIKFDVEMHPET